MGFFTKPDDPAHSANEPLSQDRIAAFLTSQGWHFSTDPDGDLGGIWDENVFYFFVMGQSAEILQVRGRWKHTLPAARRGEVLAFADDFHQDRLWPKAYTRCEDDELAVYTEVSVDLEHGVADDQLGQLIGCGLFTGLRFFDALAEHFDLAESDEDATP
jgi:hypothetical protein